MGKQGKISIIKKSYPNQKTIEGSLRAIGRNIFPNTARRLVPYKEADGRYRTGLDENALYIQRMSPEEQVVEKARVKAERKRLEAATGLDLGPRSDYYVKMFDSEYGTLGRARIVVLRDHDTVFDLEDPYEAITYAWVTVYPQIARSYGHWDSGNIEDQPNHTFYYVNDTNIEAELIFNRESKINKTVRKMEDLDPDKRRKVARLLGLKVSDNTPDFMVYNELSQYIKSGEVSFGEDKGRDSIVMFEQFADMQNENLALHDLVNQLITHSVYRRKQGGRIYDGEVKVFDSTKELIEFLADPANSEELFTLKERLKAKKAVLNDY